MIKEDTFNSFSTIYLNKTINCYYLSLRNLKLRIFGNTGLLRDQFECIDISDNLVSRLGNISHLKKLSVFIACNNKIEFIEKEFCINTPNLESLVLSNNNLCDINSISAIFLLKNLKRLSLFDNPITRIPHYKEIIIGMLPELRFLDFQKIKKKDRDNSEFFLESNNIGKELIQEYLAERDFNLLANKTNEVDEIHLQIDEQKIRKPSKIQLSDIKLAISSCNDLNKLKVLEDYLINDEISIEVEEIINECKNNLGI